ncbi:hypothetical protein WA026_004820 [Henosepilachna vigintioctopunctata]|uniref:Uncharacterized protein n=1 Tax=Henosepilachna vigintioctopunctata TaxID=420089 RepID=A0AAW1USX0_9CUCU
MDTLKKGFDSYGNFMDQEIVAVQLGCYSVALLGLTAAIRKVRPFSRFKRPKDIPAHFISEKKSLTGCVKRIDPFAQLLMIEHKPLISLPVITKGELPIKILGVKLSSLGISWLQTVIVNSEVSFIPVKKDKDFVQCEVLLPNIKSVVEKNIIEKKKNIILKKILTKKEEPFVNVGECLVKIGFAETVPIEKSILNDTQHAHYYKSLHSAELYALKKKLGLKYYSNILKSILEMLLMKLVNYTKDLSLKKLMR